ncbi:gephyrin-like molybdotransferase receptor GlpR [Streptomyces sp. KLOTTS4A1]|uniref:divisome protein SepX/GlpR n=1 Tax=Streptomyces sp. KLOTTS4A1 TaxID=3390996 RepID=UPI0039F591F6
MSSSGLIYAVIVGAWAAYLVPMWLRRQDELNEARPTERFSTAIRLLSGRAGMERRYAKGLKGRGESDEPGSEPADTDPLAGSVDVRSFAAPSSAEPPEEADGDPRDARDVRDPHEARDARDVRDPHEARDARDVRDPHEARPVDPQAAARARRSKVLARRRRTTMLLFLAFTLGSVVAAVGGLHLLWAPAVPAVLLSAYILHLRAQERRRFAYVMDRRRAEQAARRLRERSAAQRREQAARQEPAGPDLAADRRALVEQTDHAEWVDQQRERGGARGDSWDPVPVPLPTYVTAPVAPRAHGEVDLGAPDTWSSARSSSADTSTRGRAARAPEGAAPAEHTEAQAPGPQAPDPRQAKPAGPRPERPSEAQAAARRAASGRRSRERGRTPLFDQYADPERPRAANE